MDFWKLIETSNQYGFPVPLIVLIGGALLWFSLNAKWPEREKYYYEILGALGNWKNILEEQRTYYMEPGSEHRDREIMARPRYRKLNVQSGAALEIIQDQVHVGRLFLSASTIKLIENMISDHWLIEEMDAICNSDYLDKTLPLVSQTYQAVLGDAKKDLRRSRYTALVNQVWSK